MAESLFAERGIDGVSLRQIGAAIGSANTSVVAYHFGSKEALVEAIFHYRLPGIESRRRELLAEARWEGCDTTVSHLLRALWLPLFEQVNSEGRHSYAGFMAAFMHSGMGDVRLAVNRDYPTATELGACIERAMPAATRARFDSRVLMITVMITSALKIIDEARGPVDASAMFDDTLEMATAALLAPARER